LGDWNDRKGFGLLAVHHSFILAARFEFVGLPLTNLGNREIAFALLRER
jgi:hypothetical protein